MKKTVAAMLVLLFLFPLVALADIDHDLDISIVAQELHIALPANPSTGYEWSFELAEPILLHPVSEEYIPQEASKGMVGRGGTWHAAFASTPENTGETSIRLRYKRAWEDEPIKEYTLRIQVAENGDLQWNEAE